MASGDTLIVFTPAHNEPPSSNYATFDLRNGHLVLDFDASTDESAIFSGMMPRNYGGNGINVALHTSYTSATSGDAVWEVAFERIGDEQQDIDSDGFATARSVTLTVPATSGHVSIDTIAFANGTQIDNVTAGELFRLKVTRDANAAGDTAGGDGELLAVELRET